MAAKVRFLAHGRDWTVEVPVGTTILAASKTCHAPEGDACGGVCACSTCHVYVTKGKSLLTEAEEDEEDILDKAFDVRARAASLPGQDRARGRDRLRDLAREPRRILQRAPEREGPAQGLSGPHRAHRGA